MMYFAPDFNDDDLADPAVWRRIPSELPPVLTGKGAVRVGAIFHDATLFVLSDPEYGDTQVLMYHGPPLLFRYWVWDESSCLISHYRGETGDPDIDELLGEHPY